MGSRSRGQARHQHPPPPPRNNSTFLVFINTEITRTIPPPQTSPAALETSCFLLPEPPRSLCDVSSPTDPLFSLPASLLQVPPDPHGAPSFLGSVQPPVLDPYRRRAGRRAGTGHTGGMSQSRLASSFLTFAPDSQGGSPRPRSRLLEEVQPCFWIPNPFQKGAKTDGERGGERERAFLKE